MNEIKIPNARTHKRVVWSLPLCGDNIEQIILACWNKVQDNGWGTLTLRASQDRVEFDITLSDVGDEVL